MKCMMSLVMPSRALLLSLGFIALVGTGCASTPRIAEMIPSKPELSLRNVFPYTVSVDYVEGTNIAKNQHGFGNDLTQKQVVDVAKDAISAYGPFRKVVPKESADYQLYVTLVSVQFLNVDRFAAYALKYAIAVDWKLVSGTTKQMVFQRTIATEGLGAGFNGITRNTVARERAAKSNIVAGLNEISSLNL